MNDIKDKTKEYAAFIDEVRNGNLSSSKESYEVMRVYEKDETIDASVNQNGSVILYGIS